MWQTLLLKLQYLYSCDCYTKGTVTKNLFHHFSTFNKKHTTVDVMSIFSILAIQRTFLYLFSVRFTFHGYEQVIVAKFVRYCNYFVHGSRHIYFYTNIVNGMMANTPSATMFISSSVVAESTSSS